VLIITSKPKRFTDTWKWLIGKFNQAVFNLRDLNPLARFYSSRQQFLMTFNLILIRIADQI
jgi:hypothetical protein